MITVNPLPIMTPPLSSQVVVDVVVTAVGLCVAAWTVLALGVLVTRIRAARSTHSNTPQAPEAKEHTP